MASLLLGGWLMRKPLILSALLVLSGALAQSDAAQNLRAQANADAHTFYVTATPQARPLDGLRSYRCGSYAVFAGPTLSTVRYWEQQGATPQQAAEMTSLGGADAFVVEMAARAPDTMTPDDFHRKILIDCLQAAAKP
jgi:hypothetical protein